MKIIKYALLGLGVLIVLVGAVLAYVAATFDPNQYKPQIVQAVKQHTGRTLKLEGDIGLSFWPSIGAKIGKAALSERATEKEFAAVEEVRVSLKLMPLLSRRAVVDTIRIKGLRANVVKTKDGKTNVDDLTGVPAAGEAGAPKDAGPAFQVDVAGVEIVDAALTYADQAAGARYALSKLNLKTGRIAPGTPVPVELSVHAQGDKPKIDLQTALKGKLAFVPGRSLEVDDLTLETKGAAAQLTNLALKAAASAKANIESGEFTVTRLNASVSGASGKDAFTVEVESALRGDTKSRSVSVPQLKVSLAASGPDLPGKKVAGELTGSAAVNLDKERVQANLAGRLADIGVKARLDVAGFAPPGVRFDVEADSIDVDRYLPQRPAGKPAATAQKPPEKEEPFDLSGLRNLRAAGTLKVGALKANNVRASNVRLDLKANGGRVDVNPLAADFYQGKLASAISINAAPATPTFAVKHNMSGINIGPLLKDLADNDMLEGRGDIAVDVTSRGNTVGALKKALDGTAALKLADGAVKGIDIAGSIRDAKAKLGALRGEQTQAADNTRRTDFSELSATFKIANGVARNKDLSLKSPLLRVGGEGEINIGEDSLDYVVKASIVGTVKGQGGQDVGDLRGITVPVRVAGPLAAPSYKLDFGAMVTESAKKKIEDRVTRELERRLGGGAKEPDAAKAEAKPGGDLRDALKGLFRR